MMSPTKRERRPKTCATAPTEYDMTTPEDAYERYTDPETGNPAPGLFVEAVVEDAKAYIEAQKELITLQVSEQAGRAVAVVVVAMVLFFLLSAGFLMGSVAFSLWLAVLLGSTIKGFLAMAGIYVLLGVSFYLLWRTVLRDRITVAVINAFHGKP